MRKSGKNIVERGRPQKTIWRMGIACWIPKATNKPTGFVILISFPLQQWSHPLASVLRYTYIACLVSSSCRYNSVLRLVIFNHILVSLH